MKAKIYTVTHNGIQKYDGDSQAVAMKTFFACKHTAKTNNHVEYAEDGVITTSHVS